MDNGEHFLSGRVALHCGDCLTVLPTLAENSIDACVTDPPYHLTSIVKRFGGESAAPAQFGKDGAFARASKGFMQKTWDGGDIAFRPDVWREVYRVLKPGAHLLAFGGTRTYHRMACAIEDAGFEIRDCLSYIFGSGFPKNHDISKRVDRCNCSDGERSIGATLSQYDLRSMRDIDVSAQIDSSEKCSEILFAGLPQQGLSSPMLREESAQESFRPKEPSLEGRGDIPQAPGQLRKRQVRSLPKEISLDGAERRLRDGASSGDGDVDKAAIGASGMRTPSRSPTAEQCEEQSRTVAVQPQPQERGVWPHCGGCGKPIVPDGFGTALKPAMELICLARKPLSERTIAANVLKWGTGAINVDRCRVDFVGPDGEWGEKQISSLGYHGGTEGSGFRTNKHSDGRWPANVLHDGSEEVLAGFPETESGGGDKRGGCEFFMNGDKRTEPTRHEANSGSASRFFYQVKQDECLEPPCRAPVACSGFGYCRLLNFAKRFHYTAKADSDDRLGSKHPTIKPLDLMQYLVRLVTPKGGLVLDPFAGTGTTGEAAWRERMGTVLIEREAEYQADIRRRMTLVLSGPDERAREAIKARMKDKPRDDGPLFNI